MGLLGQLCRNVGLMFHHIKSPEDEQIQRKIVKKKVKEEKRGNVTLRRTTIEEIEIHEESFTTKERKDHKEREDKKKETDGQ